jgi:hypothetical protein
MADGSIINTVVIKRGHTGEKQEEFTGVRNVDWLRVYVPQGSQLIQASGFEKPDSKYFEKPQADWQEDADVLASEGHAIVDIDSGVKIYDEFNKTVFANWVMVDLGDTAVITLKYRLPFSIKFNSNEFDSHKSMREKLDEFMNPNIQELLPYALLVQKQPGSIGSQFSSKLKITDNFHPVWFYTGNVQKEKLQEWKFDAVLNEDRYWAMLFESK